MVKGKKIMECCQTIGGNLGCCKVESLISIDERGQMVLPKELRKKAGIKAGDKMAVVTWGKGEKISCISLIKSDDFAGMVKDLLGPMMKEMVATQK
ncbi:MAG: HgcAB-associated protein [Elusimicrobia bacterium]|nr:HgcAB-associated protein [Elusimicrobiota bacterium]